MNISVHKRDIPRDYAGHVKSAQVVGVDVETSGLDWHEDEIATIQLYAVGAPPVVVRIKDAPQTRILKLLADPSIKKIFHYAVFDLGFMFRSWGVVASNVACTKVASKLLDRPGQANHTLKYLTKRYLGVTLDKTQQVSDWSDEELSEDQLRYAVNDVLYLADLLAKLEAELEAAGRLELAHAAFEHIPTRAQLDVLGYEDIYSY
jgi:ribonuclease D